MSSFRQLPNGCTGLVFEPWANLGISHGFLGLGWDLLRLKEVFEISEPLLLDQTHGSNVLDLREKPMLVEYQRVAKQGLPFPERFKSDAVIFRSLKDFSGLGFVLRTADCIPLLIRSGQDFALVHAGWRGLAGPLIQKVLKLLDGSSAPLEILLGPCAGSTQYEVGMEVIEQIGRAAVFKPLGYKAILDLVGTAEKLIRSSCQRELRLDSTNICTLTNLDYHSYRREGNNAGRNYTFIRG